MKKLLLLLLVLFVGFGVAQDEEAVVLRLGERAMTVSEFDARFEIALRGLIAQTGQPFNEGLLQQYASFKPQLLEQVALEFVLFAEAQARDLLYSQEDLEAEIAQIKAQAPDEATFGIFLSQLGIPDEATLRDLIYSTESARNVITALREGIEIPAEEVQAFYDANAESFQSEEEVCARHILLDTEEEALNVANLIAEGMDFAAAAAEYSTGPSGPNGGDLECFGRGRMVAPFDEAVFAANVDEVTAPVETQFGFHLILVYARTEAGPIPLEDVAQEIEGELINQALDQSLTALRASADLELFPDNLTLGSGEEQGADQTDVSADESSDETGSDSQENSAGDSTETETGGDGSEGESEGEGSGN